MPANTHNKSSAEARGHHPWRGYFYIAGATVFWGASATLGKAVFLGKLAGPTATAIDPLILAQTRVTISLVILAPILLLARGMRGLRMSARDVLLCMVLGVLGLAGSNFAYYEAINKSSVATAIILQYTAPVWVLLYMVARGRQRATQRRVAAVGLAVAGAVLAIGALSDATVKLSPEGIFWAQVAAISFAFYNIFGQGLLQRNERWRVVVYALAGASLFWLVVNPPWKVMAAQYSQGQWIFLLGFAISSMLIPFSLYFSGLQYLDPTRAIVTSCLEPVFAILCAALFVGERLDWIQMLGIAVVIAATIMIQMTEQPQPAPLGSPE